MKPNTPIRRQVRGAVRALMAYHREPDYEAPTFENRYDLSIGIEFPPDFPLALMSDERGRFYARLQHMFGLHHIDLDIMKELRQLAFPDAPPDPETLRVLAFFEGVPYAQIPRSVLSAVPYLIEQFLDIRLACGDDPLELALDTTTAWSGPGSARWR